ncbi:MAG: hypothetical protein QW648_00900 [Nanoarchaeales archaeon]
MSEQAEYLEYLEEVKKRLKFYSLEDPKKLDNFSLYARLFDIVDYLDNAIAGFRERLEKTPYNILLYENREDLEKLERFFYEFSERLIELDEEITKKYLEKFSSWNEKRKNEYYQKIKENKELGII